MEYVATRLRAWKGPTIAYSGFGNGFDMMFAGAVLKLRDQEGCDIQLVAMVPFEGHELTPENEFGWYTGKHPRDITAADIENDPLWRLYWSLRKRADQTVIVSTTRGTPGYMARNREIVKRTDHLIVCWNGGGGGTGATINMARQSRRTHTNIHKEICRELGITT